MNTNQQTRPTIRMGESAKGDNWLDTQQTNGKEMWPNSFNWAQSVSIGTYAIACITIPLGRYICQHKLYTHTHTQHPNHNRLCKSGCGYALLCDHMTI